MTSMTDARGDTVTGASARALDLFEQAVAQFQTYSGDPVATIDAALASAWRMPSAPGFICSPPKPPPCPWRAKA
jgi:hypothetical protein